MSQAQSVNWHKDIFDVLRAQDLSLVAHVPDAGHGPLIDMCNAQNDMDVVTLTTEQDGVGLLCGAWAGGRKGVLLMQSSGVGNTINALALPNICRIPFLTIVSMRGEWGEFIPWQMPMGQGTPGVLEAMNVRLFRADYQTKSARPSKPQRISLTTPASRQPCCCHKDDRRQTVQRGLEQCFTDDQQSSFY